MELVREHHFMVVFLDLIMPHINGMEALQQIKKTTMKWCSLTNSMTRLLSETRAGSGMPELTRVALILDRSPTSSSTTKIGDSLLGMDSI